MALRGLEVAQWNLVGAVGLVVACSGPVAAVDSPEMGSTSAGPVTPDDDGETSPEGTGDESGTGDTDTAECLTSWDCPGTRSCIGGMCVDDDSDTYDDDYDDDDNYECREDEDCGPGGFCEFKGAEVGPGYTWCEGERLIPTCAERQSLSTEALPQPDQFVTVSLTFVDIDGDGLDDLVAGNLQGADVLYGPGNGSFEPLPLPESPVIDVTAADFDGDGRRDIATLDDLGRVTLLRGMEDGTYTATSDTLVSSALEIEALEWGDPPTDLMVNHAGGAVQVRLSDGAGFFGDVVTFEADEMSAVAVGPILYGDTREGIAVLSPSGNKLERHGVDDSSTWWDYSRHWGSRAGLAIADFDGNGVGSLVSTLVHRDWTQINAFIPEDEIEVSGVLDFAGSDPLVGDLDGDGKDDLILRDEREIAIVLGGGHDDGTECVIEFDLTPVTPLEFAAGDLDGDGRSEIALQRGSTIELRGL